jgi:hypothetical protein
MITNIWESKAENVNANNLPVLNIVVQTILCFNAIKQQKSEAKFLGDFSLLDVVTLDYWRWQVAYTSEFTFLWRRRPIPFAWEHKLLNLLRCFASYTKWQFVLGHQKSAKLHAEELMKHDETICNAHLLRIDFLGLVTFENLVYFLITATVGYRRTYLIGTIFCLTVMWTPVCRPHGNQILLNPTEKTPRNFAFDCCCFTCVAIRD